MSMQSHVEPPKFEMELGMCRYSTDFPGLGGIIKYRYEDFVINELTRLKPLRGAGKYVYALVEKRGINHYDMITLIAGRLGISPADIGVAGIKDARAIARQLISVKNVEPEDLVNALRGLSKVKVLWAGYGYGPIKPGMLIGNSFIITVRRVSGVALEEAEERVHTLGNVDIPNFYGHQRFGLPRYSTHLVGRQIVYGDYEEAVRLFVGNPFPGEPQDIYVARKTYDETGDPAKTLRLMPRNMVYERLVLRHLARHPGDYVGAMAKLPLSLFRLLVEAYASYIFNLFLCGRMKAGLSLRSPEAGDLVALVDSYGSPVRKVFEAGDDIAVGRARELVEAGKAALVLPLPGYKVRLSGGVQGEIERETLLREGVSLGDFKVFGVRKLGVKGDYRRTAMVYRNLRLVDFGEDEFFPGTNRLRLSFTLNRGEYATILLRELMKPTRPGAYIGVP